MSMNDYAMSIAEKLIDETSLKVIEGEIQNKSKARIVRDGAVVYEGEIISIFREKNAVKEVKNGLECGISLRDFIDFKEKDIIQSYQVEKIERTIWLITIYQIKGILKDN